MCCQICWRRILAFYFAAMIGLLGVNLFRIMDSPAKQSLMLECVRASYLVNSNNDFNGDSHIGRKKFSRFSDSIKVLSTSQSRYPVSAIGASVQGSVMLRVTFLGSGRIGKIRVINPLPCGLTERAIEAARKIEFYPESINEIPRSVTRRVQYNFTIY